VPITGGPATIANTDPARGFGIDANDIITLNEASGALRPPTCSAATATTR
jgi:hypothetical protein